MASKCAACTKTVYPAEKVRCLDRLDQVQINIDQTRNYKGKVEHDRVLSFVKRRLNSFLTMTWIHGLWNINILYTVYGVKGSWMEPELTSNIIVKKFHFQLKLLAGTGIRHASSARSVVWHSIWRTTRDMRRSRTVMPIILQSNTLR